MAERAHVLEGMRSWDNNKSVVLVSTPALIGVGIGLQRANHVVLFDVPIMARTDHVQQPQNRGKQTLTHEHVDSIARSILKRDFGYDDFRHEQAAAIRTILQGENALVVFPTGAGKDDFWLKEYFIRGDLPSRQSLQRLLEDIFLHKLAVKLPSGGEVIKLNELALGEKHDVTLNSLSIILAKIELRFGLIRAVTPEFHTYQFEAEPEYTTRVKDDESPEAKAIASYSKKAKKWYTIDVNAVVNDAGLVRADIIRKLDEFNDSGFIRLKTSGVVNRYQILKKLPSTPKEVRQITDQLYIEIEYRETDAMNRFDAVCGLLTDSNCFAWALTRYFSMELPGGKSQCGHCTYCLTGKPAVLPPKPNPSVNSMVIRNILAACDVRDDPRLLARVAFGIKSPIIIALKLDKSFLFRSLRDHGFESLLKEFTTACKEEGFKPPNKFS
ncbi:hypothetical protein F5B18DRAFT_669001 [Nemania serpens]|nr:hypothetical protein F5B18DRAFT_669001 [Nemania serpens]